MGIRSDLETRRDAVLAEITGLEEGRSGEYTDNLYDELERILKLLADPTIDALDNSEKPGQPFEVISSIAE